jgi:hypothetical protein
MINFTIVAVVFLAFGLDNPPKAAKGVKPNYKAEFPEPGPDNQNNLVLSTTSNHVVSMARYPDIPIAPEGKFRLDQVFNDADIMEMHLKEFQNSYILNDQAKVKASGLQLREIENCIKSYENTKFIPSHRIQYFIHYNQNNIKVHGWSHSFESFSRTPDGILVRIRVTPKLKRQGSSSLATLDSLQEYYLFDKSFRFFFVGVDDQPSSFRGSLLEF